MSKKHIIETKAHATRILSQQCNEEFFEGTLLIHAEHEIQSRISSIEHEYAK